MSGWVISSRYLNHFNFVLYSPPLAAVLHFKSHGNGSLTSQQSPFQNSTNRFVSLFSLFVSVSFPTEQNEPHLNIIIETGCPANIHRICQTISGRRVFWEQLFVYLWMSDLNTLPPAAPCYVIDFHDHSESHDNIRGSTGLVSQYNNIISGMAGRTEEAFREGGGWSS